MSERETELLSFWKNQPDSQQANARILCEFIGPRTLPLLRYAKWCKRHALSILFTRPCHHQLQNLPNNRLFLLKGVFKTEEEICLNGSDCAESAALWNCCEWIKGRVQCRERAKVQYHCCLINWQCLPLKLDWIDWRTFSMSVHFWHHLSTTNRDFMKCILCHFTWLESTMATYYYCFLTLCSVMTAVNLISSMNPSYWSRLTGMGKSTVKWQPFFCPFLFFANSAYNFCLSCSLLLSQLFIGQFTCGLDEDSHKFSHTLPIVNGDINKHTQSAESFPP